MQVGEVYVHRCSGAYVIVINVAQTYVVVRMLEQKGNGAEEYVTYEFIPEELETVEAHLRRNLKELEFKQELIANAKKRQEQKQLEDAVVSERVN